MTDRQQDSLRSVHPKPGSAALLAGGDWRTLLAGGINSPRPPAPASAERIVLPPPTEAHLPGSPPKAATSRLATAAAARPEPHHPSLPERELGTGPLKPDRNEKHGHPGVDCWDPSLPRAHAHRCEQQRGVAAAVGGGLVAGGEARIVPCNR